ncbi:hypothetical protein D3C80_2030720 [compost metagenome]
MRDHTGVVGHRAEGIDEAVGLLDAPIGLQLLGRQVAVEDLLGLGGAEADGFGSLAGAPAGHDVGEAYRCFWD